MMETTTLTTDHHKKAEEARQVLADLESRRDGVTDRLEAIDQQRKTVAHGALTGNDADRDALAGLKREAAELQDTLTDIGNALDKARRDVAEAEAAVAKAARLERARARIKDVADPLEAAGKRAGEALEAFVSAIDEINRIAARSGEVALHPTTLRIHLARAVHATLISVQNFLPVAERRFLAPDERFGFGQVLSRIAERIRGEAEMDAAEADGRSPPVTAPAAAPETPAAPQRTAKSKSATRDKSMGDLQAEVDGASSLGALRRVAA